MPDDNVELVVEGFPYSGWKSIRITQSIESIAGSFAVEANDRWGDLDALGNLADPWPIAETQLGGEQLRIYKVLVTPEPELPAGAAGAPGTITVNRDGGVVVACGAGALTLVEIQRPGRRPISARDWANTSDLAGRRLGQAS